MVPILSLHNPISPPFSFLSTFPTQSDFSRFRIPLRRSNHRIIANQPNQFDQFKQPQEQYPQNLQRKPRTLFPGGYKRPDIKVPNLILQLDPDEVLSGDGALYLVDKAVSKWAGIVLLNGGEGSGGRIYDATCSLKSVLRDRAYLLVSERVDIAAAAGASGVLLSDQGLPAIVARKTMLDSKSESVVLPLVARSVQTLDAALIASKSDGADFLIYGSGDGVNKNLEVSSVFEDVKIPIFIMFTSSGETVSYDEASKVLSSGASGFVLSLKSFRLFSDNDLDILFENLYSVGNRTEDEDKGFNDLKLLNVNNGPHRKLEVFAGFSKLEDREKQILETERLILIEAIEVFKKAAPMMEEISLLIDAVSQIDEPFLVVIVGEFNSGKSTVINALLGERYLKEGVVPTTNEITFLRYAESFSTEQHCERHPDGQFVCYLPAPILKEIRIVDTPGTNVILQRQQRLTEEFVPRADLLLFVISADRPLTESEVAFLRYTQQWKKKVVFVLNKSDLYRDTNELEEAMSFVKENTQKLLNIEDVTVYPVSARSALEAKLSASMDADLDYEKFLVPASVRAAISFDELEKFLYGFLDGSTSQGMERMKLKLETPTRIADRLLSGCETLVRQDFQYAKRDLALINDIINSVNEFTIKVENESLSWRRQSLSVIKATKSCIMELAEATLQLSNLDLVVSYVFKGDKSITMPATSRIQNDIISPAVLSTKKLLEEYENWLRSYSTQQGRLYKESFQKHFPSAMHSGSQLHLDTEELLKKVDIESYKVIENFNASATSKLFEKEVRDVFLGTFGGLGVAGLSASLLTSVLPTTLEDLLALGLCSAGGYLAISNFPSRRQQVIEKVERTANSLAKELEDAMKKDLWQVIGTLQIFVEVLSKPYRDQAQNRLDTLLEIQDELSNLEKKLRTLQIDIQNLHVS